MICEKMQRWIAANPTDGNARGFNYDSLPPKGLEKVARGLERSVNPWWDMNMVSILKGCERVSLSLIGLSLLLSHPFRMRCSFWDGSRGFRCAPTPGYLLQPLRGKELQLILKDHNRAEQIARNIRD
jgi:hypothetical protein